MADETKSSPIVVKPSPEGGKSKDDPGGEHSMTVNLPPMLPPTLNTDVTGKLEIKTQAQQPNHYENWYSNPDVYVAVFTGFLVLVTGILATYTWCLWKSTKKLVKESRKDARRDLRAYVAIKADGLSCGSTPTMRIVNFGKTPAHRVSITAGISRNAIFIDKSKKHIIVQGHLLSPTNHFAANLIQETPPIPTGHNDSFCIFGEIDYTDVYLRRWRTNFIWEWGNHGEVNGEGGSKHNWWPHHTGNNEEYLGKDPIA